VSAWVDLFFNAASAQNGGVIRRSVYDVERFDVLDEIVQRAKYEGWHVIETGGQIVVLCHEGSMVIHC
jgi:hypothetical protein